MKLEIKHLAIAFTNNWKVTYFDDERELNQVCNIVELREDECTISNGEYEYDVKFDDIKLLCFPLSALTKEMIVNGEIFIPIEVIMKSIGINGEITIDDEPCFGWDESYGDDAQGYAVCFSTEKLFFGVCYCEDIHEGIFTDKMLYELPFEYKQFQKLLEWKFDVFGLIEAGLAEPVTEDFNPYK